MKIANPNGEKVPHILRISASKIHLSKVSATQKASQLARKRACLRLRGGNRYGYFQTVLVRMDDSRNIFVIKTLPHLRPVTINDLQENLRGYDETLTSFTTIFHKASASRDEADSWELGMAIYAHMEAYILHKRIYLANSRIKLGKHAFHRANELLVSSGVILVPQSSREPPLKECQESRQLFKVFKKGSGIDRNSGAHWIYMLSHPSCPLKHYIRAEMENNWNVKIDPSKSIGLPQKGRILTPLLKLTADKRISCLSLTTMAMLSFLCAKNFTRDINHILLNNRTSEFGFPRDWFHEFQRLQRILFPSYLAIRRLKGQLFTPKLGLKKVNKWMVKVGTY